MAEAKLENRTSEQSSRGQSVARRGEWLPAHDILGNPFSLMRRLSEEMDRAFASTLGLSGWSGWGEERPEGAMWAPAVEVKEKDGNWIVTAELPGIRKEDLKVQATDQGLLIHGERRREHEEKRGGYYRTERSYGQFSRIIPLPAEVETDKIEAQLKDGVLEVKIPMPESQRRKQREIPIRG